jgi:hypothetical protein
VVQHFIIANNRHTPYKHFFLEGIIIGNANNVVVSAGFDYFNYLFGMPATSDEDYTIHLNTPPL